MNAIVGWFARNSVAANVLMFLVVVGGLVVLPQVKVEVFPEFTADIVTVNVPYPGAAPAEVEEGILVRLEEELRGIDNVDRISSTAIEGMAAVTLEVRPGADTRKVASDVKARVDAIDSFPDDSEEPVTTEVVPRAQVINVAVSGDASERSLKLLAERVRDELLVLDAITLVDIAVARPYEVSIEVSETALRRHGITFDEVANAVRRGSLDVPGGAIKADGGEILLRTKGQAYDAFAFGELPVLDRADGSRLLVRDVATVIDGFEDTDLSARFDGEPVALLQVFRTGDENALDVAGAVKGYVAEAAPHMPDGVKLTTWRDDSRFLSGRIRTLLTNGWQGLALVFLVLALFLRLSLSFWVTLGIPISFLGTVMLMPTLDVSINVLSLFAFIVVLGIVVDDAIVVGESIFKRLKRGEEGTEAAVRGAQDVAIPVVFAVLTSVAAFAPLAVLPGFTGKIWRVIPMVVIPTLLFSIIESQWILPAHLRHARTGRPRNPLLRAWAALQGFFEHGLERFIERVYRPSVAVALSWRYATLAVAVSTVVLTAGLIGSGALGFSFFPKLPADDVSISIDMPQGTPFAITERAVQQAERAARELAEEAGGGVVRHVMATVGEQPWLAAKQRNSGATGGANRGAHLGEVHVALVPAEERIEAGALGADEFVRRWRERVGAIAGAERVSFESELMGAGLPIDVQLSAANLRMLEEAAADLAVELERYPGVFDVADSFEAGKRELELRLRPEAEALGVRQADLGRQVRQAFFGEEAQRFPRGREEVDVMVRYPAEDRRTLASLSDLRIRRAGGGEIPFETVAEAEFGRGYAKIQRSDQRRVVSVRADVDDEVTSANDVNGLLRDEVLPELEARYPGLHWSFEGERKQQQDTLSGLFRGLVLALFAIYGLMAVPFRSYLQPLIVMTAIPFGVVGAFWGHLIVGIDANVLSMCGMLALAGVVVNDNLVLVSTINRLVEKEGVPLFRAVVEGATSRFRPILLTSLTTFAGLTPLMLEKELQAQFLIPMAVSLAFGVLFATAVSLVLVPALYLVLEDLRPRSRRTRR